MRMRTLALAAALGIWAVPAHADDTQQADTRPLPKVELENLTQTGAKTFDDFFGRVLVLEFFAHW